MEAACVAPPPLLLLLLALLLTGRKPFALEAKEFEVLELADEFVGNEGGGQLSPVLVPLLSPLLSFVLLLLLGGGVGSNGPCLLGFNKQRRPIRGVLRERDFYFVRRGPEQKSCLDFCFSIWATQGGRENGNEKKERTEKNCYKYTLIRR